MLESIELSEANSLSARTNFPVRLHRPDGSSEVLRATSADHVAAHFGVLFEQGDAVDVPPGSYLEPLPSSDPSGP